MKRVLSVAMASGMLEAKFSQGHFALLTQQLSMATCDRHQRDRRDQQASLTHRTSPLTPPPQVFSMLIRLVTFRSRNPIGGKRAHRKDDKYIFLNKEIQSTLLMWAKAPGLLWNLGKNMEKTDCVI